MIQVRSPSFEGGVNSSGICARPWLRRAQSQRLGGGARAAAAARDLGSPVLTAADSAATAALDRAMCSVAVAAVVAGPYTIATRRECARAAMAVSTLGATGSTMSVAAQISATGRQAAMAIRVGARPTAQTLLVQRGQRLRYQRSRRRGMCSKRAIPRGCRSTVDASSRNSIGTSSGRRLRSRRPFDASKRPRATWAQSWLRVSVAETCTSRSICGRWKARHAARR
eukprot:Amastigsp_a340218_48.p2 type:complete len:226 gc:universal Amastigsp_a340218_48:268-945(+)